MNYTEKLQNVTVLGAAGKWAVGFVANSDWNGRSKPEPENKDKLFILYAMDISQKGLAGLMNIFHGQVINKLKKKAVTLRQVYADRKDLIENSEIIDQYVKDVMHIIRPVTTIESAYESTSFSKLPAKILNWK